MKNRHTQFARHGCGCARAWGKTYTAVIYRIVVPTLKLWKNKRKTSHGRESAARPRGTAKTFEAKSRGVSQDCAETLLYKSLFTN